MAASRAVGLALALAGCFAPSVPTGGYLCAADSTCPSGQHCRCGLCVKHDDEAACGLTVTVDPNLTVREHERFNVAVVASTVGNAPASGFGGWVDLSFRLPDGTAWADVRPARVQLHGGAARLTVTVNRETIPPQQPTLQARFADTVGQSAPIQVLAPSFSREADPIARAPFGWADLAVGQGAVVPDGRGFRMYFVGGSSRRMSGVGVGVATSPDGKIFTPASAPVFPDAGFTATVLSVGPYRAPDGWHLAVYGDEGKGMGGQIWLAGAPDGLGLFSTENGGLPVVGRASCDYCGGFVWFPSVLGLSTGVDMGAGGEWLMFFGAGRCAKPMGCQNLSDQSMAIGRARSTDGVSFTAEPAPVLSSDAGGETYLTAPQVLKDGSVYKMWYAFTRDIAFGDPCLATIDVGYATSSDGFYWVRSPSNPVLALDGAGWEGNTHTLLPSAVVPADGQDPESGLFLYYSPLSTILIAPYCIPTGIGRAVAQQPLAGQQ